MTQRLGLIVNPLAGIGGRVGLKGSDGVAIQQKALALGGISEAQDRAAKALQALVPFKDKVKLFTPPGEMGELAAWHAGFEPVVLGSIAPGATTAQDTQRSAQDMQRLGMDLLLFAGGDGTARDIYNAVGTSLPTLGIPAGVKMHSPVFAIHPSSAGWLAVEFLFGPTAHLQEAEVIDLDEEAYRLGVVATRLYGTLIIPYHRLMVQNQKVPTPASQSVQAEAIAAAVIEEMRPGFLTILGPGTTTRAVAQRLGFPKTLVGVDVITRQEVVALDVGEARILELIGQKPALIVVTITGGQGFLFGRGNQPISPQVLRLVGKENLIVISPSEKLNALQGQPLLVDTGDTQVDQMLSGYLPVLTGYRERVYYRVAAQVEL